MFERVSIKFVEQNLASSADEPYASPHQIIHLHIILEPELISTSVAETSAMCRVRIYPLCFMCSC